MPKVRSKALSETVKGILVFPVVTKGGFIVGAPGGEGVLFEKGKSVGHYSAGEGDLVAWRRSNIVVTDAGAAKDISALTARKGVFAFVFDRKGVMAGVGIVGQSPQCGPSECPSG
jgi:lipid-binding SYLF domain-containing protein